MATPERGSHGGALSCRLPILVRPVRLALVVLPLAVLAACASPPADKPPASPAPPPRPKRGEGTMPGIHATTMAGELAAAGLDPKNLPPLETLDRKRKLRVMRTFTAALGVTCFDCHADGDFAADTRRKRAAKRMYNEITRVFAMESGAPIYCDSCHEKSMFTPNLASVHEGALFVLDRGDRDRVTDYMNEVFVGKLKRIDGRDHQCSSCHGDPPDFHFISTWKNSPAPNIELPMHAERKGER